jgi:hypothetical protein
MQTLFADVILNSNGDLSNEAFHRFGCASRYRIQKGMRDGNGEIRGLKLSTAPELTQNALAYDLRPLFLCVCNDEEKPVYSGHIQIWQQ